MIELKKNPNELKPFPKRWYKHLDMAVRVHRTVLKEYDGRTLGLLAYSAAHLGTDWDHPMRISNALRFLTFNLPNGRKYCLETGMFAAVDVSDSAEVYFVAQVEHCLSDEEQRRIYKKTGIVPGWYGKKSLPMLIASVNVYDCDELPDGGLRILNGIIPDPESVEIQVET